MTFFLAGLRAMGSMEDAGLKVSAAKVNPSSSLLISSLELSDAQVYEP